MSVTARQAAEDLLSYLNPEQRTFPPTATEDNPLPWVLRALNGGLSETATLGPLFYFRGPKATTIYAPVTLAVTGGWTAGASTAVLASGPAWLPGCSIKIGAEPWNEIVAWNSGTSTATLLNPHMANGTGNALVYCDSVAVDTDVLQVMPPVNIADGHKLKALSNRNQLFRHQYDLWREDDFGFMGGSVRATRNVTTQPRPTVYWVDTNWRLADASKAKKRIRLGPMPTELSILQYRARLQPIVLVTTDLYATLTPSVDPGTALPFDDAIVYEVFLPIARKKFTACPLFRSAEHRKSIDEQYIEARAAAKDMSPSGENINEYPVGY
jgi:hypothetical protein